MKYLLLALLIGCTNNPTSIVDTSPDTAYEDTAYDTGFVEEPVEVNLRVVDTSGYFTGIDYSIDGIERNTSTRGWFSISTGDHILKMKGEREHITIVDEYSTLFLKWGVRYDNILISQTPETSTAIVNLYTHECGYHTDNILEATTRNYFASAAYGEIALLPFEEEDVYPIKFTCDGGSITTSGVWKSEISNQYLYIYQVSNGGSEQIWELKWDE